MKALPAIVLAVLLAACTSEPPPCLTLKAALVELLDAYCQWRPDRVGCHGIIDYWCPDDYVCSAVICEADALDMHAQCVDQTTTGGVISDPCFAFYSALAL